MQRVGGHLAGATCVKNKKEAESHMNEGSLIKEIPLEIKRKEINGERLRPRSRMARNRLLNRISGYPTAPPRRSVSDLPSSLWHLLFATLAALYIIVKSLASTISLGSDSISFFFLFHTILFSLSHRTILFPCKGGRLRSLPQVKFVMLSILLYLFSLYILWEWDIFQLTLSRWKMQSCSFLTEVKGLNWIYNSLHCKIYSKK